MLEQYLQVKQEHPGCLLFYRMGDFYEMFFEDAEIASRALNITLTSRDKKKESGVPMCGVPHHAAETYLAQLMEKGFKVAICDQIEDPKQAKGLVKRAVTRVLTPGTVVEDSNLSTQRHNYLAAFVYNADKQTGALAWIDFSTGEWTGFENRSEIFLWQWLAKIDASEILLANEASVPRQFADLKDKVTFLQSRPYFDFKPSESAVLDAQSVAGLDALDLQDKPELVRACGALLAYVQQTQKKRPAHLGQFQPLNLSKFCILDEVTERNLEIFRTLDGRTGRGTLLHVVNSTLTPMGARLLETRLRNPWRDLKPIKGIQDTVQWLYKSDSLRASVQSALNAVYDLERLSTRISLNRSTPRDFIALRSSLSCLPALHGHLLTENAPQAVEQALKSWDMLDDLHAKLAASFVDSPPPVITEGGLFQMGYNADLDEMLELTEHGEQKLQKLLERERVEYALPKLKLGFNRVFGYYFELSKSVQAEIPDHFIRRQTLVNSERFITPELKDLEDRLLGASEKRKQLEYDLFQELREEFGLARPRLMFMAEIIAQIDYCQGLAEKARKNDWVRPELHEGLEIAVQGGRHPVVESVQGAASFVPNDLHVGDSSRVLLITGPNMAGKSTVLRQSAIICLLAQIGSFVPAAKASIGLVDRIFSRVGASDNLAGGQSTFMVEMMEAARILRQATRRSFIILDEIGRGTSTFDGLALAWAMAEELAAKHHGLRTLFATHYHELTALQGMLPQVRNYNIAVKEFKGDIIFLRRMVPGPADQSYGIEVAKLAGVPQNVVRRAKEILGNLEAARGDARDASAAVIARQTLLPGLSEPKESKKSLEEPIHHPLLDALNDLDVNGLTPLQALNLIHEWKKALDES